MKKILLLLILLIILFIACNTTEPPVNGKGMTLNLEDVSCTEAWITLTTTNLQLPLAVTLLQDGETRETINVETKDTLLYIDSLLPNQTYKLLATMQQTSNASNEITVTTMDTTSHDFTFETFTFGGTAGSSTLYDVAIINDSSIWAVGEIYMNDTLGQPDPNAYNAAHWDGNEWELKRIKTNACGGVDYPPIQAIFAFSNDDILFAHIDGSITHYNGIEFLNDCSLITQLNGSANKMWGRSNNDFYVVSSNGFVAHFQNGSWTSIVSGTNLDFYDIWGDYNQTNNNYEIIAVAAKEFVTYEKKIFRINGNSVQNIPTDSIPYSIHGVWFKTGIKYFIAGDGLYSKCDINTATEWEWLHPDVTNYYLYGIRGEETNDLFACGAFGEIIHYNGSSWKSYVQETSINGTLNNIDFQKNRVVAVGSANPKAIIIIGTR